jgi:hypothetical protein
MSFAPATQTRDAVDDTLHPTLSFANLNMLLLFFSGWCIVLILYFASSLLIFPEIVRIYGIMAMLSPFLTSAAQDNKYNVQRCCLTAALSQLFY